MAFIDSYIPKCCKQCGLFLMKPVSFGDVSALKGCVSLEKGLLLLSLQGRHLFNKEGQLYFRWCT